VNAKSFYRPTLIAAIAAAVGVMIGSLSRGPGQRPIQVDWDQSVCHTWWRVGHGQGNLDGTVIVADGTPLDDMRGILRPGGHTPRDGSSLG
jgi:hypothetical protein